MTDFARALDSFRFDAAPPRESVWPSMRSLVICAFSFRTRATSLSSLKLSSMMTALFVAKLTLPLMVT